MVCVREHDITVSDYQGNDDLYHIVQEVFDDSNNEIMTRVEYYFLVAKDLSNVTLGLLSVIHWATENEGVRYQVWWNGEDRFDEYSFVEVMPNGSIRKVRNIDQQFFIEYSDGIHSCTNLIVQAAEVQNALWSRSPRLAVESLFLDSSYPMITDESRHVPPAA